MDKTVTVKIGKSTDTATEGTDYENIADKTITILAGQQSATVDFMLTPTDDAYQEADETISIEGTLTDVTVTPTAITLTSEDTTPEFAIADASAVEGGNITFTVTRSGATGNPVSVKWATTADGTGDHPAATTDYTPQTTAQTLSFAAGDSTKTITIATTNDVYHEEDETFLVKLSDPSPGSLIKDGTAIGTITDNDAAPTALTLTVDADTGTNGIQSSIAENGGARTVKVTATFGGTTQFDEAKTVTVTIGKATDTATEGTDYEEVTNQSITIPAYSASASTTFTLTPKDDDFHEADETIAIEGELTGITTITPTAITLNSEDAATKLSIADATAVEGEDITFTVTRSGATGNPVSVKWTTATDSTGDHPAATIDYSAQTTAQTLNFAAGDTSETITIATTDDAFDEELETFLVTLSDPSADTSIDDATAIGTITASASITFTLTPKDNAFQEADKTITIEGTLTDDVTITGTAIILTSEDATPAITPMAFGLSQ